MEDFSHVCTRGDACFSQEQDSPLRSPHVGEWSEEDLPQGVGPSSSAGSRPGRESGEC
uniref:Uncharacterized protein n=1 Tax=Rhinopithecus bieti TaxID=61621 RepID=A0A2K6KXZ0_RHIBE